MIRRIAFVVLAGGLGGAAGCDSAYSSPAGANLIPPGPISTTEDSGTPAPPTSDGGVLSPGFGDDGGVPVTIDSPDDGGPTGTGADDGGPDGAGDEGGPVQTTDDGGSGAACSCAGGPADCAVWTNVFMTNYGFFDNSCTVENQHTCNTIAFPGLGPKKHPYAVEAAGTYDDPITAAAASDNSGKSELESMGGATLSPGTLIYNPLTQKYYIMEDQCAECTADYNCKYDDDEPKTFPNNPPAGCKTDTYFHIDFWMGPSFLTDSTNIQNCEDNSTIGDVYEPTQGPLNLGSSDGTVIINPPSNLPVRSGLLFVGTDAGNGGCWTSTQVLPNQEVCN